MTIDTDILLQMVKDRELLKCDWKSEFQWISHHLVELGMAGDTIPHINVNYSIGNRETGDYISVSDYKKYTRNYRLKELGV